MVLKKLKDILNMYSTALGMEINMQKSTLAFNRVEEEHVRETLKLFPFH